MRTFMPGPGAWSAKPHAAAIGMFGILTQNWNCAEGYPKRDRGYKILASPDSAGSSFNKGGASFSHRDKDGAIRPWHWYNGEIFRDTGGGATSLESGLTDTFVPTRVGISHPDEIDVLLLGTNSEARIIRDATLTANAFDMIAPSGITAAQGTGGTIADGTYYLWFTALDDAGGVAVESAAQVFGVLTITAGGGTASIDVDATTAGVFATRATKYRVYLSTTANAITAAFQAGADTDKNSNMNVANTTVGKAFPHRNGIPITSEMPLAGADLATLHDGRLVIGATDSSSIFWSQRSNANQWRTTNTLPVTTGAITGTLTGLASNGDRLYAFTAHDIYEVSGEFAPDTSDIPQVNFRVLERGVGCVGHDTIVVVPGLGVFFMSLFGPCVIVDGTVLRLGHDDFADLRDRLDYSYANRWTATFEHRLRQYVCFVTRKVGGNYPPEDAAVAGICDYGIRWDIDEMKFSPPYAVELTHINRRPHPASPGTVEREEVLCGTGPHGEALQLYHGYGWGLAGDLSGTDYNSKGPTSFGALTAAIGVIGYGGLRGVTILVRYPKTDTAYPGKAFQRTISSDSEGGGATTLNWLGALPTPTGTDPSIRIAGALRRRDRPGAILGQPGEYVTLEHITALELDRVGYEARS